MFPDDLELAWAGVSAEDWGPEAAVWTQPSAVDNAQVSAAMCAECGSLRSFRDVPVALAPGRTVWVALDVVHPVRAAAPQATELVERRNEDERGKSFYRHHVLKRYLPIHRFGWVRAT